MKWTRYLAYLGFAAAAFVFWALFYMFVLGVFPFPAEPPCVLEPGGCQPPSIWVRSLNTAVVFATVPSTALAFVFFRRWVRRIIGLNNNF